MDDDLRAKVRAKTEADLNAPVYLVERIDPSIIGGIMLEVRGKRYDASRARPARQHPQDPLVDLQRRRGR